MVQTTLPQASARYVTGKDIIKAEQINKTFPMPDKGEMTVLRDISITLHEGEVLALLGRSGSGKSTLLRILAGLIPASSGTVLYNGKPIEGPNQNVTMITWRSASKRKASRKTNGIYARSKRSIWWVWTASRVLFHANYRVGCASALVLRAPS